MNKMKKRILEMISEYIELRNDYAKIGDYTTASYYNGAIDALRKVLDKDAK